MNYTDGTSEQTMTVDTDTIRFNGSGKTVRSIELPDYGKSYLIGRVDATELVLNFDDEGNLALRAAEQGYIPIGSYAEMQLINAMEDKSGRYRQEADIDLLSEPWVPVTNFKGEFDGAGYEFSNILIDLEISSQYAGLFGTIDGAVLSDIHLVSGVIEAKRYACGAICANAQNSIIENCSNQADVNSSYQNSVGGIVGELTGGSIVRYCINSGNVVGLSLVGGIVGSQERVSTVEHCENTGDVSSIFNQTVASYAYAGGISGSSNNASNSITNCRNSGSILMRSVRGYCGGIVGEFMGTVTACSNSGALTVSLSGGGYGGGIAGVSSGIATASYNIGLLDQTGGEGVGGIVGSHVGEASIVACYNIGYIRLSSTQVIAGGILGFWNENYISTVTSCYWKEDEGVSAAIGTDVENTNLTVTDVYSFADTFIPDAQTHPEWGTGGGETFGWWKNYDGNGGLPQLWWE